MATLESCPRGSDTNTEDLVAEYSGTEKQTIDKGKPSGDSDNAFEAFSLFRTYFDKELKALKSEISEQNFRFKDYKKVELKKEGHKVQFDFNSDIIEGLLLLKKELLGSSCEASVYELITSNDKF